jgi:hypothetical protein
MPDPPLSPHPLPYAPAVARESRDGIISFVCGLIAVLSLCLSLIAVERPPGSLQAYTGFIGILIFVALAAVVLLGLVTGIVGVLPPRRKRALAITGLILNGLVSLFVLIQILFSYLRPG